MFIKGSVSLCLLIRESWLLFFYVSFIIFARFLCLFAARVLVFIRDIGKSRRIVGIRKSWLLFIISVAFFFLSEFQFGIKIRSFFLSMVRRRPLLILVFMNEGNTRTYGAQIANFFQSEILVGVMCCFSDGMIWMTRTLMRLLTNFGQIFVICCRNSWKMSIGFFNDLRWCRYGGR